MLAVVMITPKNANKLSLVRGPMKLIMLMTIEMIMVCDEDGGNDDDNNEGCESDDNYNNSKQQWCQGSATGDSDKNYTPIDLVKMSCGFCNISQPLWTVCLPSSSFLYFLIFD